MPSFGRLGKHGNRSQHALPEQLLTGVSSGAATSAPPSAGPVQAQHQLQQGVLGASAGGLTSQVDSHAEGAPPSSLSPSNTAPNSGDHLETFLADARSLKQQQQPQQPQQQQHHHHQQQQQQQHHHQEQQFQLAAIAPPPPPPHLFNTQSGGVNLPPVPQNNSGRGGSPVFDEHQSQTPIDFDPAAVSRSQSQRYGAPLTPQQQQQQQQHVYGVASSSIDNLPGTQQQQQPLPQSQPAAAPASQKRSTRKLIKGIFGSSRDPHDNLSQPNPAQSVAQNSPPGPYNNTAGLARRPSKRVSNSLISKPNLTQAIQSFTDRDWQSQSPGSQQLSPLEDADELDEFSLNVHGSNVKSPAQESRTLFNKNGTRQYSREQLATSSYDEAYDPPDHPPPHQQLHNQPLEPSQPEILQRQGTVRSQDHPAQYDHQQDRHQQSGSFDPTLLQGRQLPLQHFHYPTNSPLNPYQQVVEPRLVTSQLSNNQQPSNADTISQISHDSPVTDSDARSALLHHQLQQGQSVHRGSIPSQQDPSTPTATSAGTSLLEQEQSAMPPPAPGSGSLSSRRAHEAEKGLRSQADVPLGPPPGYHRQGSSHNTMSPLPTPGQDQGRNSPQPSDRDNPELEKQFKELLTKYKSVKRLYFERERQIEQLRGQVEHLQNAVANQRLSQSRTAWDDNEYSTRFSRLDGAIHNLAFNIRKDWRSLPPWVDAVVSVDALKTGKQEMTAVGRAIVSRWLVEELFNRCFHPALEPQLSEQLKDIELSIRGNSHTLHSQEEVDALTAKLVNWRMATFDGLQQNLGSPDAAENRSMITSKVTTNLTAHLYQFLSNPPPSGVDGSTSMIAELAVAIAANLPLESRDVAITYPMPGDAVQSSIMEVEKAGLPPLEGQRDHNAESGSDVDEKERDKGGKSRGNKSIPGPPKETSKVRLAAFVALEVRGRQVLGKAPVWVL